MTLTFPRFSRWHRRDNITGRLVMLAVMVILLVPSARAQPTTAATPPERSGEEIVRAQCSKCHESGLGGAPKIGDREAWILRLKAGLDPVVRSAINGHGKMPARGGMANLTDRELRSAIVYMFTPASSATK